MGFGDVIEDHNSLVDKVIYYMKNNSRMEDKYRKRVDNFLHILIKIIGIVFIKLFWN